MILPTENFDRGAGLTIQDVIGAQGQTSGDHQIGPGGDRYVSAPLDEHPLALIAGPVDRRYLLPENGFPKDAAVQKIIQVDRFHTQAEKLVPQPQVRVALGLLRLKPPASISVEKSTSTAI